MSLLNVLTAGPLKTATPGLFGVADPVLASNVGEVANWTSLFPLLDISKKMNQWDSADGNQDSHIAAGRIDAETTWIIDNPLANNLTKVIVTAAEDTFLAGREYRMRWTGTGTMILGAGGTTNSTSANEVIFTADGSLLRVEHVAGSGTITGLDIVETQYTARYDAGERWHPEYLEIVKDLREIRFMDANHINNSTQDTWGSRPITSMNSYTEDTPFANSNHKPGISLELCIQLCNKIKADMYWPIPARATDDYITQAATLIFNTLDADLKWVCEPAANELWNPNFGQYLDFIALAGQLWPDAVGVEADYGMAQEAGAWKTWHAAGLIDAVFAGQLHRREICISTNPTAYPAVMDAPIWQTYGGNGNSTSGAWPSPGPYTRYTHIAITSYFGTWLWGNATAAAAIEALYPGGAYIQEMDNWLRVDDEDNIFGQPNLFAGWATMNTVATTYGLKLRQYEGGPHMIHSNVQTAQQRAITRDWLDSAFGATYATECVNHWLNNISEADGPYINFYDVDRDDSFGLWAFRSQMDSTPAGFMERLLTENAARTNTWGDTRNFRHGAI